MSLFLTCIVRTCSGPEYVFGVRFNPSTITCIHFTGLHSTYLVSLNKRTHRVSEMRWLRFVYKLVKQTTKLSGCHTPSMCSGQNVWLFVPYSLVYAYSVTFLFPLKTPQIPGVENMFCNKISEGTRII